MTSDESGKTNKARRSESLSRNLERVLKPYVRRLNDFWCGTSWFKRIVRKAFAEADVDKNGTLSEAEMYVCVLKIYEKVNTFTTSHVKAPKKKEVLNLMKEYDMDKDGALNIDEFLCCSRAIFGIASIDHSVPINVIVVLSLRMFILPLVAKCITYSAESVGGVGLLLTYIPIAAYTVFLEIMLRLLWSFCTDS